MNGTNSVDLKGNITVKKQRRKKVKKETKPLNIAVRFEDTLTDSNYVFIDLINSDRERSIQIDYDDFDESNYISIWEYPEVTIDELAKKEQYIKESFKQVDLAILAKDFLHTLVKMNHTITIFTEYDKEFQEDIREFLAKAKMDIPIENIVCNVTEDNVLEILEEMNIEMYIEDNPYIIRVCDRELPLMVVRSQFYNQTCFNMIRLECYSQGDTILKRASSRIEKIKKSKGII